MVTASPTSRSEPPTDQIEGEKYDLRKLQILVHHTRFASWVLTA